MPAKQNPVTPPFISTLSKYSALWQGSQAFGNSYSLAATVTWVAFLIQYIPIYLPWAYPVKRIFWQNGASTGGQCDIGIMNFEGKRLYSCGPVAQSGASAPQYTSLDLLLMPGTYYIAFWKNQATSSGLNGLNGGPALLDARSVGCFQEAGTNNGIPATATFGAFAQTKYAHTGITRTSSGF